MAKRKEVTEGDLHKEYEALVDKLNRHVEKLAAWCEKNGYELEACALGVQIHARNRHDLVLANGEAPDCQVTGIAFRDLDGGMENMTTHRAAAVLGHFLASFGAATGVLPLPTGGMSELLAQVVGMMPAPDGAEGENGKPAGWMPPMGQA